MIRKILFILPIVLFFPITAFAGSQTFSTPGAYTFTVPAYGSLTVEVWAGGAEGQGCGVVSGIPWCGGGQDGGDSSFGGNVIAHGGHGAGANVTGTGIAGGNASGGDVNKTGEAGNWNKWNCPGGGGGNGLNPVATRDGKFPGGGAHGYCLGWGASGGGGGGYAKKTYAAGALSAGQNVSVKVGKGGASISAGGPGANGQIIVTWTDAAPPPPPPPPTPVCNATTIPTTATSGTSGSQTFSTPGTHTFTVPKYDGTLKVEVWGGGGGGHAGVTAGGVGGRSLWNRTVIANGGGGAKPNLLSLVAISPIVGVGGTASGGTTNLTGNNGSVPNGGSSPFGGTGGTGGRAGTAPGGGGGGGGWALNLGGGGGGGGYSRITYDAGAFAQGSTVNIVVGAGGSAFTGCGGFASACTLNPGRGAPGAVKISWTSSGQTSTICAAGFVLKGGVCVSTAVCTVCPPGQTLNANGRCVPDTACAPGFHLDLATNKCVIDPPVICINGFHLNTATNKCVPDTGIVIIGVPGGPPPSPVTTGGTTTGGTTTGCITVGGTTVGDVTTGGTTTGCTTTGGTTIGGTTVTPGGTIIGGTTVGGVTTGGTTTGCITTGGTTVGNVTTGGTTTGCITTGGTTVGGTTTGGTLNLTTTLATWNTVAVITWDATSVGATSCTGTHFNTAGAVSGSASTAPIKQTTTFTVTCATPTGPETKSVTIVIDSCPTGFTGTPPICIRSAATCGPFSTGTPPSCTLMASCPIGFTGTPPDCVSVTPPIPPACIPSNICSGNNVVNSCTGALVRACAAPSTCVGGACIVPPPTIVSWSVTPLLVAAGDRVTVSWDVLNVASCSIHDTVGDVWTSLTDTQTSRKIFSQTLFTLDCLALPGSGAANVSRSATVNIVPTFMEK